MLFQIDASKCVACSACLRACPVEAIGVDQGAAKVGEEIRQLVETAGSDAGYPVGMVTVSVGVSHFGGDAGSDDVLDAADQAQYRAKGAGGNRVVIAA